MDTFVNGVCSDGLGALEGVGHINGPVPAVVTPRVDSNSHLINERVEKHHTVGVAVQPLWNGLSQDVRMQ